MDADTTTLICTIIGTGIVVITAMAGLFVYFSKKISEKAVDKHRLDTIISRVDKLPCELHQSDIMATKSILLQKYPQTASLFGQKHSPMTLSPLGLDTFVEIKGADFLKDNKQRLFSIIDENKIFTALDVEKYAYAACSSLAEDEVFNDFKNYIYNRASIVLGEGKDGKPVTYDMSLGDICFILSIPLRDMYLKEHPELKTE